MQPLHAVVGSQGQEVRCGLVSAQDRVGVVGDALPLGWGHVHAWIRYWVIRYIYLFSYWHELLPPVLQNAADRDHLAAQPTNLQALQVLLPPGQRADYHGKLRKRGESIGNIAGAKLLNPTHHQGQMRQVWLRQGIF